MTDSQSAYDSLFCRLAADETLSRDGWEIRQETPAGAYLHLSRAGWFDENMNGIHIEAYVLGEQLKSRSAPVMLHVEGGVPFQGRFMELFTERAKSTILKFPGYTVLGPEGSSVCEVSVPFEETPSATINSIHREMKRLQSLAPLVEDTIATCKAEQKRITVLGSANIDIFLKVDSLPLSPGSTTITPTPIRQACGGKGANQAIACRLLSEGPDEVTFIGNMGSGGFGETLRTNFEKWGVRVLETDKGSNTEAGTALILVSESTGDNTIVVAPGSNFFREHFDTQFYTTEITNQLANSRILLTQLETTPKSVLEAVISFNSSAGRYCILNPAPSPEKWSQDDRPLFGEILERGVDILIPNEEELLGCFQCLFGIVAEKESDETQFAFSERVAKRILDSKPKMTAVVVTLGAEGAMLVQRNGIDGDGGEISTSFVKEKDGVDWGGNSVVDTVGAGDSFCGAFASYLSSHSNGGNLAEAGLYGCTAAGYSVRKEGAQTSYITMEILKASMAITSKSTVPLRNGGGIPLFGLGTWLASEHDCVESVTTALLEGYRLIDTAALYENEEQVGAAIAAHKESGGESPFVVTKHDAKDHSPTAIRAGLLASLSKLQLKSVDLFLLHSPSGKNVIEAWLTMLALRDEGLAKHVGVSNFGISHLEGIKEANLELPEVNQIELSVWNQQRLTTAFHAANHIVTMGYCPLARMKLKNTEVKNIADSLNCGYTEQSLAIRWSLERKFVTIPKSTNKKRISSNLAITSLPPLSEETMFKLASANLDFKASNSVNNMDLPWEMVK